MALAKRVQAQLVRNLCCIHGIGQILLVGKHQQDRVAQLILQCNMKLRVHRPGFGHTRFAMKDKTACTKEIMCGWRSAASMGESSSGRNDVYATKGLSAVHAYGVGNCCCNACDCLRAAIDDSTDG